MFRPKPISHGICFLLVLAFAISIPYAAVQADRTAARKHGLGKQFMLSVLESGKCLSKVSGDKLAQQLSAWKCRKKSSNQKFSVKWTKGPWFMLRAVRGGLCVEVSGGSKSDAKPIVQWTCNGKPNQQWKMASISKRTFQLQAKHSGKCLTLDGASKKVSKFVQRKCSKKNKAQRFSVPR